jgi:hypothetical protein
MVLTYCTTMSSVADAAVEPLPPYDTTIGYVPMVVLFAITHVSGVEPVFVQEIEPAVGVDESVQVD